MVNADLLEMLRGYEAAERPVGFSIWRSGDLILWGYIREIVDRGVWFQQVDPLGNIESDVELFRWSRLMEFDFGAEYGERIERFREFTPTVPNGGKWRRSAMDRDRIIGSAIKEELVAQIWKPDGSRPATIPRCSAGGFLTYAELNNSCIEQSLEVIRLSLIVAVREFDAMAEAETWLWRQNNEEEKS